MQIIGCDLHVRQQTVAMLDTLTGEVVDRKLMHEGNEVREFYSQLPRPALVGVESIGPIQWFLNLLEELGIECQVGDATKIRAAEPRQQKYDRRDAKLILKLLVESDLDAPQGTARSASSVAASTSLGASTHTHTKRSSGYSLSEWFATRPQPVELRSERGSTHPVLNPNA
jgi:hypothetical protein